MKFQIPINVTIACSVCGEKLDAAFEFDRLDNYDFSLVVEPCKRCTASWMIAAQKEFPELMLPAWVEGGLTRRAPDACPACRGKRYVKIGMYHEVCEACNGTGKRR